MVGGPTTCSCLIAPSHLPQSILSHPSFSFDLSPLRTSTLSRKCRHITREAPRSAELAAFDGTGATFETLLKQQRRRRRCRLSPWMNGGWSKCHFLHQRTWCTITTSKLPLALFLNVPPYCSLPYPPCRRQAQM